MRERFKDKLTHDIHHEADEPVMCSERQQDLVYQQNVLEIVDNALSVQEVHCDGKEVPVQRPRQWEILPFGGHLCDVDDLLEADDLNSSDQEENVNVSAEHGQEEAPDHCQGPYRTSDKGLFLLLIFILLDLRLLLGFDPINLVISRSYGTTAVGHSLIGRGGACSQFCDAPIRLVRELNLPSRHFVRRSGENVKMRTRWAR